MDIAPLVISGARFIGNQRALRIGGDAEIRDSLFFGNVSATRGGALVGNDARLRSVNNTFASNRALSGADIHCEFCEIEAVLNTFAGSTSNDGNNIFNEESPPTIVNSVSWPAALPAGSGVTHSCFPGATGTGNQHLSASPFVTDDADGDGVDEFYLDPSSPCVDAGNASETADTPWQTLTTNASQCLDTPVVDMGRHHTPAVRGPGTCP
jgi:hypothetical protein